MTMINNSVKKLYESKNFYDILFQLHVPMAATARRSSVVSRSDSQCGGDGIFASQHIEVSSINLLL